MLRLVCADMDDTDTNLAEEVEDDDREAIELMAETSDDASESMSKAGSGRGRKAVTIDRPDPLEMNPIRMSF